MPTSKQIRAANIRMNQRPTTPAVPMSITKVPSDPDDTLIMSKKDLEEILATCKRASDRMIPIIRADERTWTAEDVTNFVEEEREES
jgi:hypothetical protein